MNEYAWNQDVEDDDEQELDPRSLPKQLRQMLAASKKEITEAKAENARLAGELRTTNIASVLASKGVSSKVAKLIPADVETSQEAIETWLEDYKDVFGLPPQANTTNNQVESEAGAVDADQIAAIQRIQNTTANSQPSGSRNDAILAKVLDPETTEEELRDMIKRGGL
jgi:hypothetical protein